MLSLHHLQGVAIYSSAIGCPHAVITLTANLLLFTKILPGSERSLMNDIAGG